MGNHFHLVLETPEPTLVAGMKWMRGTYTQRFNARHRMRGRPFAGRYKALLVDETEGNDLDAQRNRVPAACRKLEITGERALSKCVNMNVGPRAPRLSLIVIAHLEIGNTCLSLSINDAMLFGDTTRPIT